MTGYMTTTMNTTATSFRSGAGFDKAEKKSRFGNFIPNAPSAASAASGISTEIWGPLTFGTSGATKNDDELRGSSALQQSSVPDHSLARPSSSNAAAWAANGNSANFALPGSGAVSPLRQRTAQTTRSNSPLTGQPGNAGVTSQTRFNPETNSFNPGNSFPGECPTNGALSRASSTQRSANGGVRAGYGNDFAASLNGFNGQAAFNSQSASRNGSYPPSRHGQDVSPTDASFSMNEVNERLPRNGQVFDSFDRPHSSGQGRQIYFGQMPADRRPSAPYLSSAFGTSYSYDGHSDTRSVRTGSIGSNAGTPSLHQQIESYRNDSNNASINELQQELSLSLQMRDNFPILSNSSSRNGQSGSALQQGGGNPSYLSQLRQYRGVQNYPNQPRRPAMHHNAYSYPSQEQMLRAQMHGQNIQGQGYGGNFQYPSQINSAPAAMSSQRAQMYYGQESQARHTYPQSANPQSTRNSVQNSRPRRSDDGGAQSTIIDRGTHWVQRQKSNGSTFIEASPECKPKDILGKVAIFCGDQSGSRLVQDMIENANNEDKEAIFQEMLPNVLQLCQDPFGNYVIQKFFEYGVQRQKQQMAGKMRGRVETLSTHAYGCRCVQKAFEHILHDQQLELVEELKPCLYTIAKDTQGNHVVQKVLQNMEAKDVQFILNGFEGQIVTMSNDAYACRVIQRLLEYGDEYSKPRTTAEILQNAYELMKNPFGNYVVQHIIEQGSEQDRDAIVNIIEPYVAELMVNKFASNVVERCLQHGTEQHIDMLVAKIGQIDPVTEQPKYLREAMTAPYGNYVVQRTLKTLPPGKWEGFAALVASQMQWMDRERGNKKFQEFERLLKQGPNRPEKSAREPEFLLRRTGTDSISQGTGTPPPLTRTQPSPQSSNTPSTSNSMVDGPTGGANSVSGSNRSGDTVVGEKVGATIATTKRPTVDL